MDTFSFEELIADMLDITDQQREDDFFIEQAFWNEFGIDLSAGFKLAKRLLMHTPTVKVRLSGNIYHAFVSKTHPVILAKVRANEHQQPE